MLTLAALSYDVSVEVVPFSWTGILLQLGMSATIGLVVCLVVWLVLRKKPGPR